MPWLLAMEMSPEQADALSMVDIHPGRTAWWFRKQEVPLEFARRWLPQRGQVETDLTFTDQDGTTIRQAFPISEPQPSSTWWPWWYKPYRLTPGPVARVTDVVTCQLSYVNRPRLPFLPITYLGDHDTRHAVYRYLAGCSEREVVAWLGQVGRLDYDENVSFGDTRCIKYRFVSRAGESTVVDVYGNGGLNIIY